MHLDLRPTEMFLSLYLKIYIKRNYLKYGFLYGYTVHE